MKKTIIMAVFAIVSISTYASVSKIRSNGNVSGVPSFLVECSSGSDFIIYKKDGEWCRGDTGHMGGKYNSWSKIEVADYICN